MDPFLLRTLELARIPGGAVGANPLVGAVVVHGGKIIGEGCYRSYGGPHAEVNAVASVERKELLRESTLYVSLEPCSFYGKTPACVDLVLREQIPKVVIGAVDPNPKVSGQSVERMRAAGIEVEICPDPTPFLELIAHFHRNQLSKRPFITLKWAESSDGFMAGKDSTGQLAPTSISAPFASRWVHWKRHEHQAILVGKNTVLVDDPSLTTRKWPGRDPLRIVLDRKLALPPSQGVFGPGPALVVNDSRDEMDGEVRYFKPERSEAWDDIGVLMAELYARAEVGSILVEGGAQVHRQFLEGNCFDAVYQNIGQEALGDGLIAPILPASVQHIDTLRLDGDDIRIYRSA